MEKNYRYYPKTQEPKNEELDVFLYKAKENCHSKNVNYSKINLLNLQIFFLETVFI